MDVDWQADLDRWLAPFVAALRHKTRARMCPASHEGDCVKLLHFDAPGILPLWRG
jgi:hypothetical protein